MNYDRLIILFVYSVLALFLILPVGYILLKSFYVNGSFSPNFFILVFDNPLVRKSLINSFITGILTTVIATVISFPLCFIMLRYRFPFKGLLRAFLLVPMVLPPFVGAIGLKKFFAGYGPVNIILTKLGIITAPLDWFSVGLTGVIVLEVLHLYPIMFLNLYASMAGISSVMQESAENLGASKIRAFRTITVPLMAPGFFAGAVIVFIWAFTDLGTPLMFDFNNVIPVQIFNMIRSINQNNTGYTLCTFILIITCLFFYLSKLLTGKNHYEIQADSDTVPREQKLSFTGLFFIYFFVTVLISVSILPHISVLIFSLSEKWFMSILPASWTFSHYRGIFFDPLSYTGIKNSLLLSFTSMFFDVVLGIMIAYALTRKKIRGLGLLDTLVMLPLALPGVIVAFGYIGFFSGTIIDPRFNPVPLLIIAYTIRRLPFIVRSVYSGFQQRDITLEEASLGLGASRLTTIVKVSLPLMLPNIIAGGLLCFSFAMLEVSDSLILAMQEKFYPLTKSIYSLFNNINEGPYLASALGVIGIILLAASIMFTSKILGKKTGELFRAG
ncbi:MAG: iron ABC transporter permease [Oligoflexia bacterium]|nr:iron ABC transporter permease [Oligoflexia bacterium]